MITSDRSKLAGSTGEVLEWHGAGTAEFATFNLENQADILFRFLKKRQWSLSRKIANSSYIKRNNLNILLFVLPDLIEQFFIKSKVKLSLEPNYDSETDELVCTICTNLDADDASIALMNLIDEVHVYSDLNDFAFDINFIK